MQVSTRNLWPLGICLAFALFALGTACLVAMACSQKADLVSSDYYEQELKFQGQIERVKRTDSLGNEASVAYDRLKKAITISMPIDQTHHNLSGRIQLYRPSAAALDQELSLDLNQNGTQVLDASNLRPGLWKVRVSWTTEGKDYFIDKRIVVGS